MSEMKSIYTVYVYACVCACVRVYAHTCAYSNILYMCVCMCAELSTTIQNKSNAFIFVFLSFPVGLEFLPTLRFVKNIT